MIKKILTSLYLPLFVIFVSSIITIISCFAMITNSYAQTQTPSKSDLYWLTMNIYHEARGESNIGKVMVGLVTLERLSDGRWGKTVKDVVTAKNQFSWYWDGKSDVPNDKKAWQSAKDMAVWSIVVYNAVEDTNIMFYHNTNVSPYWNKEFNRVITVGNHVFYRE